MDLSALYNKLSDPGFQDPAKSDMYYNYYVFPYDPAQEYELEQELLRFKNVLVRPVNYIDVLSIDIFEEFCEFLDKKTFGKHQSYLKYLLDKDKNISANVLKSLSSNANSEAFYTYLNERILAHISKDDDDLRRPFIFIYGLGRMYPYLRTNVLLTNYENYNEVSKYKIILFYPGRRSGNSYNLFNVLEDSNIYRATKIIDE